MSISYADSWLSRTLVIFDLKISQLLYSPKTKLSGLKICPKGPDRTESIVPGSKSTRTALGTYFPPKKICRVDNNRLVVALLSNENRKCRDATINTRRGTRLKCFKAQEDSTCSFVVVHVDPFQLKVGISVVCASWIDAMLIGDYFPELKSEHGETWAFSKQKIRNLCWLCSPIIIPWRRSGYRTVRLEDERFHAW